MRRKPYDSLIGIETTTSLALPFPLRPDFIAQLIIPKDMTADEATRLKAFVMSLALERAALQGDK